MSRRDAVERAAVLVLGTGATGVAVARAAATERGRDGRVVLIGDGRPGGGGRLVSGGAGLLEAARRGLDWRAARAHLLQVRAVVEDRCREAALRADGVDLVRGRARLLGGGRVAVETRSDAPPDVLAGHRVVLATGDELRLPDLPGLHETRFVTPRTVLTLGDLPPSVLVVGGGPSGCELAQALARFGTSVTLVEAADRLLPHEHPDASVLVTQALRADGVRVFTSSAAVSVAPTLDGGAWIGTAEGGDLAAELLVLATGRRAAVQGLDLATAGVQLDTDGWVRVDRGLATTASGVLAAGRVTGRIPHGARDPLMARAAGVNAARRRTAIPWSAQAVPRVVRTVPEVAAVGLAPDAAASVAGARVSDLPLAGLDTALLADCSTGRVALVAGPSVAPRRFGGLAGRGAARSQLLGASIVGPQAAELADLAAVALRAGLSVEDLAGAPLSWSTWGAALARAAAGFADDVLPDDALPVAG